jgi:hypothetical protein
MLNASIEHADEDADPEQAAQGDDQHDQQVIRGVVGVHRVGGERLRQDVPKDCSNSCLGGHGIDGHDAQRGGNDQDGGRQAQPADQGDGAARQGAVEAVAQPGQQGSFFHRGHFRPGKA